MAVSRRREIESVERALSAVCDQAASEARRMHALLREGAGEEPVMERLRALSTADQDALLATARDLLRIGVRPAGRYRQRQDGPDVCTICERELAFCWGCRCGFRLCQDCLEHDRWGFTCNNITWECPECGGMRSF